MNISRWIHTSNKALTLSWRNFLSYRNQSIDLLCKSTDRFLYDRDLRHKRVKTHLTPWPIILRKPVLACHKTELAFFSVWVFFHEYWHFRGQQGKGEPISLYPFYYFHSCHRPLDISQVVAAGSLHLRIDGSQTRTRNLWFPNASC